MVLLPEIGGLALALWCLAMALAATILIEALIDAMGGVPVIGGVIKAILSPVAHAISWAAGKLEHGIDWLIGATWHSLAHMTEWFWRQFVAHTAVFLQIAELVGHGLYRVTGLRAIVHHLEKVWRGIEHGVKNLIRQWHGIERRLKVLEREVGKGIGKDLRTRVNALEDEYDTLQEKVIPDVRKGIRAAEGELTQLENFIKAIPGVGYLDWAAGIVAAVLSVEALNLLKCNVFRNLWGNRGCGLWRDVETILGMFIDTLLLTNICTVLPWLEDAFGLIESPIIELLTEIPLGDCERLHESWATMGTMSLPVPPPQPLGTLAA